MAREEQKQRSGKVRQAILETALAMGIREGFEAVSVRKIIHEMNYSTGVLYHHFTDKQEIIDAIEEQETAWLYSEIRSLQDDTRDIVWNMERIFARVMRLAWEEPEKYNLIVLHKYSRHTGTEKPQGFGHIGIGFGHIGIGHIAAGLLEGMAKGQIRRMDAEKAAFAIWSSFLGFNLMISRHRGMSFAEAEELFRVQLAVVLKGILTRPEDLAGDKEEP